MFYATAPPLPRPVRKVGAPLIAIIAMVSVVVLMLFLVAYSNPGYAVVGFGLSTAAMGLVLACYVWLDRWEPEPPRLLVMAFLWGASVAVVFSMVSSLVLEKVLGLSSGLEDKPNFWMAAVVGPAVEEAYKGMFLLLMMTGRRRNELNSLTDCLIYAGVTAVGFAWLEDVFYIAGGENLPASLSTAALRLLAGPFAHPLFTSMIGIGVFFALKQRTGVAKFGALLLGYLGAVLMHALWNGSAMIGPKTYIGVYVLWMMPTFGAAIALALSSRKREGRIISSKLPGMVAAGLLTPAESAWVGSLPARRAAVRDARQLGGRPAARAVRQFNNQVAELAYVRDRIDRGFGDARVLALQNEEAHGLMAARAAAEPTLFQLNAKLAHQAAPNLY